MATPMNSNLVYRLKTQFSQLLDDVNALKNGNSEIYQRYFQNIIQAQQDKSEKLQKWHENEIEAAHRECECDKYAADCDEKEQIVEKSRRIADYIYYKADKITNEFPEAAAYFQSQGYHFDFDKVKKQKTNTSTPKVAVVESNHQLIDLADIDEDINTFTLKENEIPECFQNSEQVKIKIGNFPELTGVLSNVNDETADFTVDGKTIQLDLNAIRFGSVVCTKA
ncbi:hypothetical protein TVAG_309020 [Trichomonas vaginalis G3]|uniref:Uncharacterized protein n=1 Tax=Trichomonas vaginalis (strain ATCC PRA-98 / G3) TaxID=412133 RepID=A2EDP8_TRIV3|nr:hypothetical protein TVAGG3_0944710 [Trichomonas vaginalis G3]EAY09213.1 hypothetical protein TVAG_309020 [Trichomonas vaginalis G3]KAI5486794.1 hypothetical protein TVAGG3_0944710 [Trichomonas vaginalis G3]|eukprot:XP_001321436.1 hypothetical protein [Trichomonas vaginalis G3]